MRIKEVKHTVAESDFSALGLKVFPMGTFTYHGLLSCTDIMISLSGES